MIMPGSNAVDLPPADGLQSNGSGVKSGGVEPDGSGPTEGSLSLLSTDGCGGSGSTVMFGGGACLTGAGDTGFFVGTAELLAAELLVDVTVVLG